jgi:hypothetical protein
MNERMQELYDQAFTLGTSGYSNGELDVGKFAELIVQEYTEQLIQHGVVSADGTIVKDIQKHFGVEND